MFLVIWEFYRFFDVLKFLPKMSINIFCSYFFCEKIAEIIIYLNFKQELSWKTINDIFCLILLKLLFI